MGDRLDFSFQVIETTVRVLYADITRLDVDALVSTDDVHLAQPPAMCRATMHASIRCRRRLARCW